ADALHKVGRNVEARKEVTLAIAVHERWLGPDIPDTDRMYRLLGEIDLDLGAPRRAVTSLRRAHTLATADFHEGQRAEIDFALARALLAAGESRSEARSLAASARKVMAGDARMKDELPKLDRWLKAH